VPIFLTLFTSSPAQADDPLEEVLSRIETLYGKAGDVSADFLQRSTVEGFGERLARGKIYLKKPSLARWDYTSPVRQRIYVNDRKITLYSPESHQAVIQPLSTHPDAEPAMGILSRVEKWRSLFQIRPLSEGDAKEVGTLSFELIPRQPDRIRRVVITAERKTGVMTGLALSDSEGGRAAFEFSKVRFDQGLQRSLFEFAVPKGVDVLEYPP
jgi:outer membrane lipoprotein carrier protein